jgi:hypothetical protein
MEHARSWKGPLFITIAVMMAAIALSSRDTSPFGDSWGFLLTPPLRLPKVLIYYIAPLLLVTGAFYARSGMSKVLAACLACLGVNAVILIIRVFWPRPSYESQTPVDVAIKSVEMLTDPARLLPLLLLVTTRFRPKLERLRIASIILLLLLVVLDVLASVFIMWRWSHATLFALLLSIPEILTSIACLAALGMSAWCMAFRQIAPNRPPIDAQQTVSLTCPRCQANLQIELGHDACPACRLQILISLEEGVCAKCAYPLRGLTGDKCPECGTPFVADAPTSVAAGPTE